VRREVKSSTDLTFPANSQEPLFIRYQIELQKCIEKYIEEYEHCNWGAPWTIIEPVAIQHYQPREAFFDWHFERVSSTNPVVSRHLVFMTYLNTLEDGGETEFLYQEAKIKPIKGKTLIWPADWTHTHRGLTSNSQDKFIITGWLNFYDRKIGSSTMVS
jgi:hypothetical protein